MSKHRAIGRTPRVSARVYMTTGVSGAALIGVGVLLSAHPGAPTESTQAVQLASFGSLWAPPPLSPSTTTPWWFIDGGGGGGLFGDSITPNSFTRNALVAEVGGGAGFNIFNPIGPGGWLIGDGVDAQATPDCCSAAAAPVSTAATAAPAGCSSAPAVPAAKA